MSVKIRRLFLSVISFIKLANNKLKLSKNIQLRFNILVFIWDIRINKYHCLKQIK